jgi:Ca-activated chloride channel family protein
MSTFRKVTSMTFLAAVGATLGALAGELCFLDRPAPPAPRSICLLFDVSGSMNKAVTGAGGAHGRSQLQELQSAAKAFVERQDLRVDAIGLAIFSSSARVLCRAGHDPRSLVDSLDRLQAQGETDLARGLDAASSVLAAARHGSPGERWILLFTDGKPEKMETGYDAVAEALRAAARVRAQGIGIVAIGTGLADAALLQKVTGSPQNVIVSAPERIADAFTRSEERLDNRQMLASRPGAAGFRTALERAGIWASLIAIGAGLAMVIAQNRHLRRRALTLRQFAVVVLGGVLTGALAGAAGQSLFYLLAPFEFLGGAGRVAAWIVLGFGAGLGISLYVPNLDRRRAAAAGIAGGILAGFCFLVFVPQRGDTIGRLGSAAVLGALTAIAVAAVEVKGRKAWLVVHWSPKERSTLLLGGTPIIVGHGRQAHICPEYVKGSASVLARFLFDGAQVMLDDAEKGVQKIVRDGAAFEFGRVRVEVKVADGRAASAPGPQPAGAPAPAAPAPAAPRTAEGRPRQPDVPRQPATGKRSGPSVGAGPRPER